MGHAVAQNWDRIDVVAGDSGAGTVDRQVVVIADPQFTNPDVRPTAAGALPVQAAKDTGRTLVILSADRVAGVTSEALLTLSINKGGTVTSGTTYTVTAGKTLRLQSLQAEILNTTTTANRVLARVRSAQSVTVSSPAIAGVLAAAPAALAATGGCEDVTFPDGVEIAGGQQVGVSQLCTVTTAGIVSVFLVGYEY